MKNILIIAYYYPPLGGAGVQRTLNFVKYLAKMEYNISVLTVLNDGNTIKDDSLELEGFGNIKVYRAKQRKTTNILNKLAAMNEKRADSIPRNTSEGNVKGNGAKSLLKKVLKDTYIKLYNSTNIPDDKISWKQEAVRMGLEIIHNNNIELIYSTSGPYTSHLIAYELKRRTKKKWIADFRDQWVTNPFAKYPAIIKKINEGLEKKVVDSADYITTVSEPIVQDFIKRYKELNRDKLFILTNGYDEEDFQNYQLDKNIDKFTIAYNGTLYSKISPLNFLKAIQKLIDTQKINKDDLAVKFIGRIGSTAMEEINNFISINDEIVSIIDYLPHKESIKQLESAYALLLILWEGLGSDGVYTGKIFEYIRSGRIIIGIVPKGVARELITETNTGICCSPDSIDEISDAILNAYNMWTGKKEKPAINWEEVKKYNREEITNKLVGLIEKL
ncbi:glycosyltransferase, group 1 family protein [Clostridiales bacterium oral taxon 876 str. F0540]|nr:glycosyltransferase, group 1 family protein [Clostridiales bacterium oral taxon 876 str. F0540]